MAPKYVFTAARFHPVIGNSYGKVAGDIRLLILGESHYPWDGRPVNESETTAAAMEGIDRHRFWKSLEKLIPVPGKKDGLRGWDMVAFYNYVQHFVGEGPRDRPGDEMWVSPETVSGFKEVLAVCKPNRILVVGKTNWRFMAGKEHFPENPPVPEPRFPLPESFCSNLDADSEQNAYWYPTGTNGYALAAPVYHPAYPRGFHGHGTAEVMKRLMQRSWKAPSKGRK